MSTTVIGVRVTPQDAAKFREQASRYGLTASSAGAALIHAAVIAEPRASDGREPDQAPMTHGGRVTPVGPW